MVTGPTGVGKSAFAVELAERLNGEIIGADAFQIYAGLPILTSQPAGDLLRRVRHHLIGTVPLLESYDVARYAEEARACMGGIFGRGRVPVVVGGTGLYLKALTHGLAELPPVDEALRREIRAMGPSGALERLRALDPEAVARIDLKNPVRVSRALEIVIATGRPLAASRGSWQASRDEFSGIVLERERGELRERIERNVDAMFEQGVVDEVRRAHPAGRGASRAIGYGEIVRLLAGEIGEVVCRAEIVRATWRYAKRQLTWSRNQFSFPTINLTATTDPIEAATRILAGTSA